MPRALSCNDCIEDALYYLRVRGPKETLFIRLCTRCAVLSKLI